MAIAVFLLLISLMKGHDVPSSAKQRMIKHKGTNKCIDVAGTGKGHLLQIWDCNGGPNQLFDFGNSWFRETYSFIHSFAGDEYPLCVDAELGKANQLGVWTCSAGQQRVAQQSWQQEWKTITRSKGGVA